MDGNEFITFTTCFHPLLVFQESTCDEWDAPFRNTTEIQNWQNIPLFPLNVPRIFYLALSFKINCCAISNAIDLSTFSVIKIYPLHLLELKLLSQSSNFTKSLIVFNFL